MPSKFDTRFVESAIPVLNREFGVDLTITRGIRTSESFTGRRGDRVYQALGGELGLDVRLTMRAFFLPVAGCVIDGEPIEPRRGDQITEGTDVFQVEPPDDKRPAVELRNGGNDWLVHAKRVKE